MKTCKIVDNKLNPCTALFRALQANDGRGLKVQETIDLEKKTVGKSFLRLKSGEFSKSGVVVNFCPMCGQNISSHVVNAED